MGELQRFYTLTNQSRTQLQYLMRPYRACGGKNAAAARIINLGLAFSPPASESLVLEGS